MRVEMKLDEVLGQERTLGRFTARMPFSPHLTVYYSQRRFGTHGELFITERYIGFRGRTADLKSKVIILVLILVIVAFSQVFLAYVSGGGDYESYLLESPNIVLHIFVLASLGFLIISSLKREMSIQRGFVWPRVGVDVTLSGGSILILEKEGLTRIDYDDERGEISRILGDESVEFEISDLSGLDYHQKMDVLENRYKAGIISPELYEELKKRLPYL